VVDNTAETGIEPVVDSKQLVDDIADNTPVVDNEPEVDSKQLVDGVAHTLVAADGNHDDHNAGPLLVQLTLLQLQ
jgi:hypothetical protein